MQGANEITRFSIETMGGQFRTGEGDVIPVETAEDAAELALTMEEEIMIQATPKVGESDSPGSSEGIQPTSF